MVQSVLRAPSGLQVRGSFHLPEPFEAAALVRNPDLVGGADVSVCVCVCLTSSSFLVALHTHKKAILSQGSTKLEHRDPKNICYAQMLPLRSAMTTEGWSKSLSRASETILPSTCVLPQLDAAARRPRG